MKRILALLLISGTCFGQYDRGDTFRFVRFIQSNTNHPAEGQIGFVDEQGGLVIGMPGGGLLTIGAEGQTTVYNDTGETLTNGCLVTFSGRQGNNPKVVKVSATNIATSAVMGMVTTDAGIADGHTGQVALWGLVRDVPNPHGFASGQTLYACEEPGCVTNTPPSYPIEPFFVGKVEVAVGDSMDVQLRLDGWKTWEMITANYIDKNATGTQTVSSVIEAPYFLCSNTNIYDDLLVPFSSIDLAGLANPPEAEVLFNSIYTLAFDNSGNEEVYFTCQLSHSYWTGRDVQPHIHGISSGTVETSNWQLVSTWASIGDAFGVMQTNLFTWVSSGINGKHELVDCGLLSNTNASFSSMIGSKLKRLDGGTANDVNIMQADYHYPIRFVPAIEYVH